MFLGRGAVFLAATMSALAWNFLFLPPRFTLRIREVDDAVLFLGYFVVAALVGQLVHRLRRQEQAERQRERRTRILYELVRDLAAARSRDEVVWTLLGAVDGAFRVPAAVSFPVASAAGLQPHPDGTPCWTRRSRAWRRGRLVTGGRAGVPPTTCRARRCCIFP